MKPLTFVAQEATEAVRAGVDARDGGDMMAHTRALRDVIGADPDPKFRSSKFLSFLSKMTQGEIILEDNQVRLFPAACLLFDMASSDVVSWTRHVRKCAVPLPANP